MTDQSFPIDPTITVVNSVIDGVFSVAVKATQAALVASDPAIFGLPVIEPIDNELIQLIANALYKQFAGWVSFEILDFKDSAELTDEQKALAALKAAQSQGDPSALTQALTNFDQAVAKLTRFDGAASPPSL